MRPQDKEIPASRTWRMWKTCSMNPLKQKMTMKTRKLLWAALSMTAALMMTACSSDDNDTTEAPVAPSAAKTIPYTVTVGGDEATTRATVDSNNKTLRFAEGDKLYITGENIQGELDLKDGDAGKSSGATFSGNLEYTGGGTPADDLELTATLVSAQQNSGQVSVDAAGAVTVNYPTTAYCTSVNDAVQQYSHLTDESTYGAHAFTLAQQTAFLNFEITFIDNTADGTPLSTVVSNGNSAICTANVTTTTNAAGNVVAQFVLPVNAGTELSSATVTMGSKAALAISDATLTGKVYNVTRTQAAAALALNLTSPAVGQVIGSDGKNYDYASLPSGVTAVAKICYVSGSNGLALALTDEGQMNWSTAITTCAAHTPAFTGGTWKLATQGEWDNMITAAGSYSALCEGFSSVGGTNMIPYYYWSSTEFDSNGAWSYEFGDGEWSADGKGEVASVRACLAW